MPLMLTEVARRAHDACATTCAGAPPSRRKIWGLYPRKGVIAAGSDADLALVDLDRSWTIDDAKLQSRSKITPWHGRPVRGLPLHTLVRGRFVMRDRALVADTRGWGRSVHAIQRMPAAGAAQHRPDHARHRGRPRNPIGAGGMMHAPMNSPVPEAGTRLEPFVELEHVTHTYGRGDKQVQGARHHRPAHREGRFHRAGRPVGLRQVHHPQAGDRADQCVERLCVRRRPRGRRRAGAGRHGVPEPDAAALAHAPRQRDAAAQDRAAVPVRITAPSARASSATASTRCWRRSGSRASATNIPGSSPAA